MINEEKSELPTKCRKLKMKTAKGRNYPTDTLDTEGIFRLIESVPSPNAEPFKLWLAKGLKENKEIAKRGGKIAKNTRDNLEQELGNSIISKENSLPYQYIDENNKIENK